VPPRAIVNVKLWPIQRRQKQAQKITFFSVK